MPEGGVRSAVSCQDLNNYQTLLQALAFRSLGASSSKLHESEPESHVIIMCVRCVRLCVCVCLCVCVYPFNPKLL